MQVHSPQVKAACPSAEIVDAKQGAEPVWKWIAAVPARRITNAEEASFTWRTRPQGGEPWAYWLWVFKAADPKKDRLVSITLARDPAAGTVDITSDNLAEGILLLNDDFLDLDREIAVKVNGREVWKGKPQREIRNAVYWIGQTGERTLFVPAQVRFTVPADAQSPPKKEAGALPGGDGPKDGKGSGEAPKQEGPAAPPAPAPGGKGGG